MRASPQSQAGLRISRALSNHCWGGELQPDAIFVNIPQYSQLEQRAYEIPNFLHRYAETGRVIINRVSQDYGPGTKIIGSLNLLPGRGALVLVDDDVSYHGTFFRTIFSNFSNNESSAFSFYTYREAGLTIGQGCDGFCIPCNSLDGLSDFFRINVQGTNLVYHDDLWISYFLATKGIPIRRLPRPNGEVLIYAQLLPNTVLSALEGDRSRAVITKTHLRRLRNEVPLPALASSVAGAWNIFDQALRLLDRLLRRLAKILSGRR